MSVAYAWEAPFFVAGLASLALAWVVCVVAEVWGGRISGGDRWARAWLATWLLLGTGVGAQTVVLVAQSVAEGRPAVYDQAENLLSFSWLLGVVLAYFLWRHRLFWIGATILPVSLLTLGWVLLLPPGAGRVTLASMRSSWLLLHVLTSTVAYAAFTVTFGAALMYLGRHYLGLGRRYGPAEIARVGYRAAVLGFPFMTMVILTGALWAKHKFGVYWSWSGIEVWSLLTWLAFAAYLHAQYARGWEGARAAWLAIIAYATVIGTVFFFMHYRF